MNETNWKSICKTIILAESKHAEDYIDFITKLKHDYKITPSHLQELGFACILQINKGGSSNIYLYAETNDAISCLSNEYNAWIYMQTNIHGSPLTHAYVDEDTLMFREACTAKETFVGEVFLLKEEKI